MHCPFCNKEDTKVIDSRLVTNGAQVRRRRECINCCERFTTYESPELLMPRIVKRDGRRVPFDEDKLRMGIGKALEKRPVSIEQIEELLGRVKQQLLSSGEREVNSQLLGELIMLELKKLDEVAYVRFASVYCRFQDVSAFRQEIDRMQKESKDVTTL